MAAADYRSCDVCGCKTFYDAVLDYAFPSPVTPSGGVPMPEGNIGDWAVICRDCATSHEIVVRPKEERPNV